MDTGRIHATIGTLPIFELVLLMLVTQAGRILGTLALYSIAGLGRGPILGLYYRLFGNLLSERKSENNKSSVVQRLWRRTNLFSPYSVAFGRLIWLRVPLTLILSMRKQLRVLLQAVVLSSLVWDITYILIGVIGGNTNVNPTHIIWYSLAALTALYATTFMIRRLLWAGGWRGID